MLYLAVTASLAFGAYLSPQAPAHRGHDVSMSAVTRNPNIAKLKAGYL
jgi:hypothetical protein